MTAEISPQILDFDIFYKGQVGFSVRRWIYMAGVGEQPLQASRMRIEIMGNIGGVPKEVFVWERHSMFIEGQLQKKDRVLCVAKLADLSVYPVNDPDEHSKIPPFYRLTYLDTPFSSPDDMWSTWDRVRQDLYSLAETFTKLGYSPAYPMGTTSDLL